MAHEPVFSEQEATRIIQRAIEISEEGAKSEYQPGITPAELRRIADEVGVPADALAKAIQEVAKNDARKQPWRLIEDYERVVEGELDPDHYDLILEGVKTLSRPGTPEASQVGRTLSFSAWTGLGQAKVDLTSRNGRTRVKVRSNALLQGLMTLYPALITSVVSAAVLGEQGMGWVGAGVAAAAMTAGSVLFGWMTRKGHQRAEKLADELSCKVSETLAAQSPKVVESVKTSDVSKVNEELEQRLKL